MAKKNATTKIERLGLAKRVQELCADGSSARRIAGVLKLERPDLDVSDSAIIRYVSKLRQAASEEAFDVIKKHVDRVVPDDLKALEEMEAQCLDWAREAGRDRVERMADAAVQITGKLEDWRSMLLEPHTPEGQGILVRKIIRDCLELMAREDRLQNQRNQAMLTAIKIIDLKLRQAGLLDDEGKSPIYIVDRTGGKAPGANKGVEYKPFVIQGGKWDD